MEWRDGPERVTVGGGLDTEHRGVARWKEAGLHGSRRKHAAVVAAVRSDRGRVLAKGEPITPKGADALYPDVPPERHVSSSTARFAAAGTSCAGARSSPATIARCRSEGEMLVPRWSDDGAMLAFRRLCRSSGRRGVWGAVVLVAADGSNERNLTAPGPPEITPYDWSADGKWILASCEHGPAD